MKKAKVKEECMEVHGWGCWMKERRKKEKEGKGT